MKEHTCSSGSTTHSLANTLPTPTTPITPTTPRTPGYDISNAHTASTVTSNEKASVCSPSTDRCDEWVYVNVSPKNSLTPGTSHVAIVYLTVHLAPTIHSVSCGSLHRVGTHTLYIQMLYCNTYYMYMYSRLHTHTFTLTIIMCIELCRYM